MTAAARPLALTGLLAVLAQFGLWTVRGGPAAARWAVIGCGALALAWSVRSRRRWSPTAAAAAALLACLAFWLGALELTLLAAVLFARGWLLVLTAASLHLTLLLGALTRGDDGRSAARSRRLAAGATIALATLAAVEATTRAISPVRSYELIPDDPAAGPCLVPTTGHGLLGVPGCSGRYVHREFAGVRAEFNALGLRDGPEEASPPGENETSVVVLGDSFAYGMGVELADTFQQLLGDRLRDAGVTARVYNAAMPGSGTVHERRALERLGPRLRPDVVIVAVFGDNDLQENRSGRAAGNSAPVAATARPPSPWRFLASTLRWPYWRTTSSLLQLRRIDGRPTQVLERAMRSEPSPDIEPLLAEVREELLALRATARELGAELLVLLVPALVQAEPAAFEAFERRHPDHRHARTAFHRALAADFARRGLTVIDPLPRLEASLAEGRACYHREGHWNARGHAVVAELLAEILAPRLPLG